MSDLVSRAKFALHDMQGRVEASKLGMFSQCIDRIEALEAENARLRAELNPRFDEYGAYGENNPPVGAQGLCGRATARNPDLPASGAKIGRYRQGKG